MTRKTWLSSALPFLALLSTVLLAAACGRQLEAPPVELVTRESLMGLGKILQITNRGQESLEGLEIRIETPAGDVKNHQVPALAAGETMELGWKKLAGFEIHPGAEVSIEATGFLLPYRAKLDAPKEASGGNPG